MVMPVVHESIVRVMMMASNIWVGEHNYVIILATVEGWGQAPAKMINRRVNETYYTGREV